MPYRNHPEPGQAGYSQPWPDYACLKESPGSPVPVHEDHRSASKISVHRQNQPLQLQSDFPFCSRPCSESQWLPCIQQLPGSIPPCATISLQRSNQADLQVSLNRAATFLATIHCAPHRESPRSSQILLTIPLITQSTGYDGSGSIFNGGINSRGLSNDLTAATSHQGLFNDFPGR